ncbi:MAG: transaldolase [Thermoplasmatales archaeon SG8-52-3]|nr:MAG: transaldolase [Thermoplasmatales archaeon SG8-52-3]
MKIFIDSAQLDEIEKAFSYGIIDGVTTNPSLLKKAVDKLEESGNKITIKEYLNKILIAAKETPVSLEVTELKQDKMIEQAKKLYKIFNPVANNVNIKIPVNPSFPDEKGRDFEGIQAVKTISKAGIPVNCTLIFTPEQALLAAKAGAKYVSPFAGRIDDFIRSNNKISFKKTDYFPAEGWEKNNEILEDNGIVSGIDLIAQIVDVFEIYNFNTQVIAASIRNSRQVRESALAGAHIATLPYDVIMQLLVHYKTQEGMKKFTDDIVPEYEKLTRVK